MEKYMGRKGVKRLKEEGQYKEIKILCRYCDLKDDCSMRVRKEQYEKSGMVTRCPFTPNGRKKPKSPKK